jgi:4-amino-4-deoxy-L-arabinose transferase-like glycosyltransferase
MAVKKQISFPKPLKGGCRIFSGNKLPVMVILLLSLALFLSLANGFIFFHGGDNAEYFLLGRSIALGKGYTNVYMFPELPHSKYPPLFPLMLAGIITLFSENVFIMKIMIAVFGAVTASVTFLIWTDRTDKLPAVMTSLMFMTAPATILLAPRLLTEIPFTAFCCLAVFSYERALKDGSVKKKYLAFSVISVVAAYFTRSAGIALALSLIIAPLLQRPIRTGFRKNVPVTFSIGTPILIAAISWFIRSYIVTEGKGKNYFREFLLSDPSSVDSSTIGISELLHRVSVNGVYYAKSIGGATLPFPVDEKISIYLGTFLIAVMFSGLIITMKRRSGAPEVFTIFYVLMIFVWGFKHPRFLIPLFPMFYYYFLKAVSTATGKSLELIGVTKNHISTGVILAVSILMLTSNSFYLIDRIKYIYSLRQTEGFRNSPHFHMIPANKKFARLLGLCKYVYNNSDPRQIVFSDKPRLVALGTDRRTVGGPYHEDPDQFIKNLEIKNVDYILADEHFFRVHKYFIPAFKKYPARFELAYKIPVKEKSYVYRFNKAFEMK